jgi:hypothetical protein
MSNQTLESERKSRSERLRQHQTKQTQTLEMMEKIAVAIEDAVSPLRKEMTHEHFSISIFQEWKMFRESASNWIAQETTTSRSDEAAVQPRRGGQGAGGAFGSLSLA